MQIFISWSGEKSKQIGEAFRHWLPEVIQSVRPYFTPDDVAKGQRWAADIADSLQSSQFGLFCLTAENLTAPWLLFEAGAVSKDSRNGKVCPLLFGVDAAQLAGPLLQFQATPYSKDEVLKFMKAVNADTNVPLDEIQLSRAFNRCWAELDEKILNILAAEVADQGKPLRSMQDMVEETLSIVRSISQQPVSAIEDDSTNHWLLMWQMTFDYTQDVLKIAQGVEQFAMLEQLRRLSVHVKSVANLIVPKTKNSKNGQKYVALTGKLLTQLDERIAKLEFSLDDEIPF
jgi:hypothetical protein